MLRLGARRLQRSASTAVDELLRRNAAYAERAKPWFDKHGADPHRPSFVWIGCSDARASPNLLLDTEPGQVFVHRNIANLVVTTDASLNSVLQYSVGVLRVPHVLVCGHYDCGGVRASVARQDLDSHALGPPLEDWLRNIRNVRRLHRDELDAITDPELAHRRLVELNVLEQCQNVLRLGVVQRMRRVSAAASGGEVLPQVHPLVYDPANGRLKRLDHDVDGEHRQLDNIYDLFQ